MHKYRWYVIVFLIVAAIGQPYFAQWTAFRGVSINFVLFFIMLSAFAKKSPDIFLVPLAIGMFYDMLYSPWLGRMTIVFILGALSVMAVGRFVYKEHVPVLTVYFFISTYILENIRAVMEVGPGIYYRSFVFIQENVLWTSVYAAVLAAVFGTIFYLGTLSFDRKLKARKSGGL